MSKYYCFVCNYDAKQKSNYDKHLKTNKHKKVVKSSEHLVNNSEHLVNISEHFSEHLVNINNSVIECGLKKVVNDSPSHDTSNNEKSSYKCKYCNKSFTTKTSKYRHIRTVCKKSKDEDVNYIVELLNKKTNVLKDVDNNVSTNLERKIEKMDSQINKMMKKLQITNINNTNTIIQNFHVNDYNNPDLSHLSFFHYNKALSENNFCVAEIIKMIYFNENKPENMSIYIPYLKDKYVCLVKDGTWTTKNAKDVIPSFNEYNYYILQEWYENNKDKLPDKLKDAFNKFEKNFYQENMQENAFKLLKELLYDFREYPKKNRKQLT
uniref:C2H2-type domain-containing protein n=1 Tax=Florenciella sp. virus SA2 TaxID=3240092 RepID=A0AB39J685_9VIRU